MKCIAVDDEKLARERLVTIVKNAVDGCEVESFSGGNAAFEYAQNNHVDVAFLDIEMRGMNGIELAKKLNVPLIDIRSVFLQDKHYERLISRDGIHPNEKGYELIYRTVADALKNKTVIL